MSKRQQKPHRNNYICICTESLNPFNPVLPHTMPPTLLAPWFVVNFRQASGVLWPVLVPFALYQYDCWWPVYQPCGYISFSDWPLVWPTGFEGLIFAKGERHRCTNVTTQAIIHRAKPLREADLKLSDGSSGVQTVLE